MGRRGSRRPVVGPDFRDPRLHVALVIVSLQVLGQTVLHFSVSIAQILAAVVTSALIELAITLWRDRLIMWPSSALLTGNGVAFVLRVPGTRHGDWWSLRGAWIFAAVAAVSLLSKYFIRVDGRPLFNPSNFGLVLCFLVLGSRRVDPLDFWWIRPGFVLALALALIVVGGLILAWRVGMLRLVVSFWLTFAAALAVLALRGHCITARWHIGPVCNRYFWTVLVTSPEVLVFMFFMITDPKTAPRGRSARDVYGIAVALLFVALAAPQRTEFATKVALLGALALVCAARPLLERLLPGSVAHAPRRSGARRPGLVAVTVVAVLAYVALVVAAGALARHASNLGAAPPAPAIPAHCVGTAAVSTRSPRPHLNIAIPATIRVHNPVDIATPVSAALARTIVRDTIEDLVVAGDAVRRRDVRIVSGVARFPWLDDLVSTICTTKGPLVVPSYHVARATVSVVKRTTGQHFPEIDVELQGDVRETILTRSAPTRRLDERTRLYDETLVVSGIGRDWLVCGHRSDRRTAACVTTGL